MQKRTQGRGIRERQGIAQRVGPKGRVIPSKDGIFLVKCGMYEEEGVGPEERGLRHGRREAVAPARTPQDSG